MSRRTTTITLVALLGVASLTLLGCSQKYSAERDGKKLGEAVCDLRAATNAEDAEKARQEIAKQLDDLGNKYTMFTAEDRNDIQNNLADLYEHAIQGNKALMNQDLTVIKRSVQNVREDLSEVGQAVWDGFFEGADDCLNAG